MDVDHFKKMFWNYSKRINDNINIAIQPICDHHEITLLQARILIELYDHQTHTIGSLAKSINMAGTNISTMCKKLETMKLVKRVRAKEDERIVKVVLTEKGCDIVLAFDHELNERLSTYMQSESEHTLQTIISGLQELDLLLKHLEKGNT